MCQESNVSLGSCYVLLSRQVSRPLAALGRRKKKEDQIMNAVHKTVAQTKTGVKVLHIVFTQEMLYTQYSA